MALAGADRCAAGSSWVTSSLNAECLLLPGMQVQDVSAREETLTSNSSAWGSSGFLRHLGCLLFSLKRSSIMESCAVLDCLEGVISRILLRRQDWVDQGSKSQLAKASPVVSSKSVGGLD